jgi:hypothetical protein
MKRLRHASQEPAREAIEIRGADFSCKMTKKRRVEPLAFGLPSDLRAKQEVIGDWGDLEDKWFSKCVELLARSGVTTRKISRISNRLAVMRRIENHRDGTVMVGD